VRQSLPPDSHARSPSSELPNPGTFEYEGPRRDRGRRAALRPSPAGDSGRTRAGRHSRARRPPIPRRGTVARAESRRIVYVGLGDCRRAAARRAARGPAARPRHRPLSDTRTCPRLALEEGCHRRAHSPEAGPRERWATGRRGGRTALARSGTTGASSGRVGDNQGGSCAGSEPRPTAAEALRVPERARGSLPNLDLAVSDRREPERPAGAGPQGRREAPPVPGTRACLPDPGP
jgi:hypothetical protein